MLSLEASVIQQNLLASAGVWQPANLFQHRAAAVWKIKWCLPHHKLGFSRGGSSFNAVRQSLCRDIINRLFELPLWKRYKCVCTQKPAIYKAAIKLWRWIADFKCAATHLSQTFDTQQVNARSLSVQPSVISCHNFAQQRKFLSLPSFGVAMCAEVPSEKPFQSLGNWNYREGDRDIASANCNFIST